jgi:iron complex outermembrane receptor protein
MTRNSTLIRVAVLAALGSAAAAANAQQALEEIVVTAQKREQSVNEVPITINAYSGDAVADLGVRSAEDLTKLTPGIEVTSSGGIGTKVWTIRGVGFNDYSTSASSTVGVYADEVALPYPVMTTGEFFDIERVEVVKGPQGDLFGRNTTGGQVNIVSKRPTKEFEAGITLGYGSYQTFNGEGYLSGPFSDRVRGRIAFTTTQSSEGWQKSITRPGDKLGELDKKAVRAMLDADITDGFNALLKVYYNDDQSDNLAPTAVDGRLIGFADPALRQFANTGGALEQFVPFSVDDNEAADWTNGPGNALRPKRDNQLKGANLRLTWQLGEMELVSVTGYDKFDRREANDWDGTPLLDSSNINVTDIKSFSEEVRLSGKTDALTWVVGLYYSDDRMTEDYNYFFGEGVYGINQLNTTYDQKTKSKAVFGHVEYRLTDTVDAILGARFTSEDRRWTGCTYDQTPPDLPVPGLPLNVFLNNIINGPGVLTPNGLLNDAFNIPNGLPLVNPMPVNGCGTFDDILGSPTAGQFAVFSRKISADEPMWKAGLNWRPVDGVMLYGSISQGFKSGGFNGANSNTTTQLLPYKLEKLLAYEIGAKNTLLNGALQLNAAVFYYDYKDKQERSLAVTPVGNIGGVTNVPKSEIKGVEADMAWRVTDALTIDLGFSALDTKVKKWLQVDRASSYPTVVLRDASGLELANAPDFSGNLGVSYAIPLGGLELVPTVSLIYRGATSGDLALENARESYTLTDLRVALQPAEGKWRGLFWVRNLTDEDYYVSAQSGGNFTWTRTNGMPRTYGVSVDYRF